MSRYLPQVSLFRFMSSLSNLLDVTEPKFRLGSFALTFSREA